MATKAQIKQALLNRKAILEFHRYTAHAENLIRPVLIHAYDIMERYYLEHYTRIVKDVYRKKGISIRKADEYIPVRVGSAVDVGASESAQRELRRMNELLYGIGQAAMIRGFQEAPIQGVVFGAGFDIGQEAFRRLAWVNQYKGLSREASNRITKIVQEGVRDGESLGFIRSKIRGEFTKIKGYKANLIIRSETTRYQNAGNLAGYDLNPVVGAKRWTATLDKRTRSWHRQQPRGVHGQVRLLDEYFDVPRTGKQLYPGGEPNCRCRITSVINRREIRQAYKRAGRPFPRGGDFLPTNAAALPPNKYFAQEGLPEFNPIEPIGIQSNNPFQVVTF